MSGIEILSSTEVITSSLLNWTAFWVVLGIITGLCLIVGFVLSLSMRDFDYLFPSLLIGIMVGTLVGLIIGDKLARPTYETQYKVLISDEVSMKEFSEKYQIISQEGKIYTIREKE